LFAVSSLLYLFPATLHMVLENGFKQFQPIEEIRIRIGQAIVLRGAGKEFICGHDPVTEKDMMHILLSAANGSIHSVTEYLKQGFLPLKHGCRMGICAEGIYQNGLLTGVRNVSSLCIRIASEKHGCSDHFFAQITQPRFFGTLIVAPPGCGKTTLLRELIRKLSYSGYYISIADERGEISGMCRGIPEFDIGPRTDVLSGIKKRDASLMLLRTMSPDILAMDEITAFHDMDTVKECIGCGVELLATVHGYDYDSILKRGLSDVLSMNVFKYAIYIACKNGIRSYRVDTLYD